MVKKGEIGLAQVLCMYQSHEYLYFKIRMLDKNLKEIETLYPELKEAKAELIQFLHLEIMITTFHYAEVTAANLLAMKKNKTYHKTLLEYPTSDIINFYKSIDKKPLSYFAKLLGYPALFQLSGKNDNIKAMKDSCITTKKKLSEIGNLYLNYNGLYNNYKHGFRLAIFETGNPEANEQYAVTLWPVKSEDAANRAMIMRIENTDEEIKLCGFMFNLLQEVTEVFRQRVMNKKQDFQVRTIIDSS